MYEFKTFNEVFPNKWARTNYQDIYGFITILLEYGFSQWSSYINPTGETVFTALDLQRMNDMFHTKYGNRRFYLTEDDDMYDLWFKGGSAVYITTDEQNFIYAQCKHIGAIYGSKWYHLIRGLGRNDVIADEWKYSPLENYNMEQAGSRQEVDTLTYEGKEKIKFTPNTKETDSMAHGETIKNTTDVTTDRTGYGFDSSNSGTPVGKERVYAEDGEANKELHTGTDTRTITHNVPDEEGNLGSDDTEKSFEDRKNKNAIAESDSLTRHGNIGVTTSQQMAQSEIELRKYLIYDEMLKDILSIYSLPIY